MRTEVDIKSATKSYDSQINMNKLCAVCHMRTSSEDTRGMHIRLLLAGGALLGRYIVITYAKRRRDQMRPLMRTRTTTTLICPLVNDRTIYTALDASSDSRILFRFGIYTRIKFAINNYLLPHRSTSG